MSHYSKEIEEWIEKENAGVSKYDGKRQKKLFIIPTKQTKGKDKHD